jgi:hypothetical protein
MSGGCSASPVFRASAEGGLAPLAEVPHGVRATYSKGCRVGAALFRGLNPVYAEARSPAIAVFLGFLYLYLYLSFTLSRSPRAVLM